MHIDRNALDHARDQLHLQWLALSDAGKSTGYIGRRYGIRSAHVRTVLNRILADLAKSEAA